VWPDPAGDVTESWRVGADAVNAFPLGAALAVIFAGVLHATWNAMAKGTDDRHASFALFGGVYAVCGAIGLAFAPPMAVAAAPFAVASALLHVVYSWLLARSYRLGDFNQVYPLARGTAPMLVALVASTAFGDAMTAGQLAGVAVICGALGVLAFAGQPGRQTGRQAGRQTGPSGPAVRAALLTGVSIAAYTIVDGLGVRLSGSSVAYAGWIFLGMGPLIVGWAVAARRTALLPALRAHWRVGVVGGVIGVIGYAVVLWAQTAGALAVVAALRETGVVTGALIGVVVFREPLGRTRIAAAVAVAAGAALINLR
jgi:drug/metabolite transporter (DMT)-like permease